MSEPNTPNVLDMEPVKINKCRTDFTYNSQTGPSMRNSKKYFGKQLENAKERKGSPEKALIQGMRKEIGDQDSTKVKAVLPDELIRGKLAVSNKMTGGTQTLKLGKSTNKRSGQLGRKTKDSQAYAKVMSNKDFNKTFSSSIPGATDFGGTKSSFFNSKGFETKNKSTLLPDDDLRKIGVMNSIINEFDENTWNKRQLKNILQERAEAIEKVSKGELSKELAMLACYKIQTKIQERTEKFEKFDLKVMIKDFIITRNARKGMPTDFENTFKKSTAIRSENAEGSDALKQSLNKLMSDVGKEKLMFPEVQEVFGLLKVGLNRDEAQAFCLDIVKSRMLVKAIKQNMTVEEIQQLQALEENNDETSINHIYVDELQDYILNFGPYLLTKQQEVDNKLGKLMLREDSFLHGLKSAQINFEFSTMDYNQYLKTQKKLIQTCIGELFGTDAEGKVLARENPNSEPWQSNYANIKKNVSDIETQINEMKKINTKLVNNPEANDLFKQQTDSIQAQFTNTKEAQKMLRNFVQFIIECNFLNRDPEIAMFVDIQTLQRQKEEAYTSMIADLHLQVKVFIQTRNGDMHNIAMKDVAEIIHNNTSTYEKYIGDYVKYLSKFVKEKREAGELDLEKDCITQPLLEELRQKIKTKFSKKSTIVETFIEGLSQNLPDHVRRKGFNQADPFGDEFQRQVHQKPSNGSEKLKNKMERMWVTKVLTEKINKFKEDQLLQSQIFDKYQDLIVRRDFTFDKQIYMQNVIADLNNLDRETATLNNDDIIRYQELVNEDMDYKTHLIIQDLKKENRIQGFISSKYSLDQKENKDETVNREWRMAAFKTIKQKEFAKTINNPQNQLYYKQMELVERINTINDPNYDSKKQLENVMRGKSKLKDTSVGNPCHNLLANQVSSQEKELLKQAEESEGQRWFTRPHHIQSVTKHPKSLVDDLCAIQHLDQIQEMYKAKERLPEDEDEHQIKTKPLKFKRELENIEDEKEKNKRKIMDKINVLAIDESAKVQGMIHKQLEALRKKQSELEQQAVESNMDLDKLKEKAKRMATNNNTPYQMDYKERKSVQTDPLRTTKLMSQTQNLMLSDLRKKEQNLLNDMRKEESEIYRPPKDRWQELKDNRFNQEIRQNRLQADDNLKEHIEEKWYNLLENDLQ